MKAVILAGGAGERLRPLTLTTPKPLTRFFGSTVIGHAIAMLKANGVGDICITLGHMGGKIRSALGDGSRFGVRLTYVQEDRPLGTAGSVALCRDFWQDDSFIVMAGDAVCDMELSPAIQLHRGNGALATIVTCRRRDPRSFGLVQTDEKGFVRRFLEKPEWERVFTDCVSTGIYVISPEAMDFVPEGRSFDFSNDLFPLLLKRGEKLCAREAAGYWQDVGSPEALEKCREDVLAGRVKLPLLEGVSFSPEIEGVKITPPCYIAGGVSIGKGSEIERSVLESGTNIGENSRISNSHLMGVETGSGFRCDGATVGENCTFGENCTVMPGAVIGSGVSFSAGGKASRDSRVWSAKTPAALTPELALRLGGALGSVFSSVAVGTDLGDRTSVLGECLMCGVTAAGGDALAFTAEHTLKAAWCVMTSGAEAGVFIEQLGDELRYTLMGGDGMPMENNMRRKIRNLSVLTCPQSERTGEALRLCSSGYLSYSENFWFPSLPVHVGGKNSAADSARRVIKSCGGDLREIEQGVCSFYIGDRGQIAQISDENGRRYTTAQIWALLLRELAQDGAKTLSMPESLPYACGDGARELGAVVLRLGADSGAESAFMKRRELWDGIMASAFLLNRLYRKNVTMARLMGELPPIETAEDDVTVSERSRFMGRLSDFDSGIAGSGVTVKTDRGSVRIVPRRESESVHILAAARDVETARELCDFWCKKAKEIEKD